MFKVIAFAIMASVLHLAAATAAPSTTPPPDEGPSKVRCRCTCAGSGSLASSKIWDWSGTRGGCQGYSGGACKIVLKKKSHDGTLRNCDVIVIKRKPKESVTRKPGGGVLAPR
jgi:hypothetical protein